MFASIWSDLCLYGPADTRHSCNGGLMLACRRPTIKPPLYECLVLAGGGGGGPVLRPNPVRDPTINLP